MEFRDRREAGRLLGQRVVENLSTANGLERVVLALPRGGVPVGLEVARALKTKLEPFMVRKLGTPGNPELAMGAIASGGVCLLNHALIRAYGIPEELVKRVIAKETAILQARETAYGVQKFFHPEKEDFSRKLVILVDDGAATGSTMRVAVEAVRQRGAGRIVVALPTSSDEAAEMLRAAADEVIALVESDHFESVGQWYLRFDQTSDEEVLECLKEANASFA